MTDHTFVICAYKESEYLEECILSLKAQTMQSKIIVSTGTPNRFIDDLVKTYNIGLATHDRPGIGRDWNAGLALTTTRYVTLIHQDDIYNKLYLETVLQAMQREDSLIAFTDYTEVKDGQEIPKTRNLKIKELLLTPIKWFPRSKFLRKRSLGLGNGICCPSVTYDLANLKGFRFVETMRSNLDWEAWYRISNMQGSFIYIAKDLMQHRIHSESETSNAIESNKRTQEDFEMMKLFWPEWFARFLMKFYVKSQLTN